MWLSGAEIDTDYLLTAAGMLLFPFDLFDMLYKLMGIIGSNDN